MKKLNMVIGLAASVLVSVSCVWADEKVSRAIGDYVQYATLKPADVRSSVKVGPLDAPLDAPERQPYPVKVALAKARAQPQPKPAPSVSVLGSAAERFSETITVFGERIVPPTEVSGLEHFSWRGAKYESDEFQWTFKKFYGDTGKHLFGSDFIFRYRYPTEGAGPRGFRNGEVIVGFGMNIPLTSFRPIGLLFTSR